MLLRASKVPVSVRLLLPIAENSVSDRSLRPGDVIYARNGKSTEVTNTDAEGRLLLADALCLACEAPMGPGWTKPRVIFDFATLTGAARVALGEELPALFSNSPTELLELGNISRIVGDDLWPMPLWKPLSAAVRGSRVADLLNSVDGLVHADTTSFFDTFC